MLFGKSSFANNAQKALCTFVYVFVKGKSRFTAVDTSGRLRALWRWIYLRRLNAFPEVCHRQGRI